MGLQEANSCPVSWCGGCGVGTGPPGDNQSLPVPVDRGTECVRAQQKPRW